MAAQVQVEAKSLSDINFLAANPPQYPNNPTEEKQEALVLYISRVPGTRDVILSTFKPQRKNVTGEDVANSLYYVHLDLPSDEHLAPPRPFNDPATPRSSGESARSGNWGGRSATSPISPANTIPRKPLPANAQVPKQESHAPAGPDAAVATTASLAPPAVTAPAPPLAATDLPPRPSPAQQLQPSPQIERIHAPGHAVASQGPLPASVSTPRRPLGPRPMGSAGNPEMEVPPFPTAPTQQSPFTRPPPDLSTPAGRARPSIITDGSAQLAVNPAVMSRSPSPSKRRNNFVPFSLTIIRRDPTSGNQWNIGKVSSLQSNTPLFDDNDGAGGPAQQQLLPVPNAYPAINIKLETSGYAKFRGFPMPPNLDVQRPGSAKSFARSLGDAADRDRDMASFLKGFAQQQQQQQQQDASAGAVVEDGFTRQLLMSYTKTWTTNLRDALRKRDRSNSGRSRDGEDETTMSPPGNKSRHFRQGSANSVGSVDSMGGIVAYGEPQEGRESPPPLITQPGTGLKPKGYVFSSPWDGRCEFRTGSGGRSLKCRHVLANQGGGFNPLVLAQGIRDGNIMSGGGNRRGGSLSTSSLITGAAPVSELRFNLPSADLFRSKEDRERAVKELHGHFDRLIKTHGHRRHRSDEDEGGRTEGDSDDDEPIFDLSLGREKAGGGNRGKRAKLGKLIIYDEGLKMLDLVVAANVGVWWGAWERIF